MGWYGVRVPRVSGATCGPSVFLPCLVRRAGARFRASRPEFADRLTFTREQMTGRQDIAACRERRIAAMANDPSGARNQIAFAHPDALTEPEKLLAVYFNSPTVGLGIIDADFRFLAVNHVLAEINGIPAAAHVGRSVREVLGEV